MPDLDVALLRSVPVPAAITEVAGCSCGGLDWHKQDCTIWSTPADDAIAAVEAARRRVREYGDELNRQLRAALGGLA